MVQGGGYRDLLITEVELMLSNIQAQRRRVGGLNGVNNKVVNEIELWTHIVIGTGQINKKQVIIFIMSTFQPHALPPPSAFANSSG